MGIRTPDLLKNAKAYFRQYGAIDGRFVNSIKRLAVPDDTHRACRTASAANQVPSDLDLPPVHD